MRLIFMGALTAIGLSVAAPSGAFAAAIAPVGTAAGASQALPVHYYGYYRYHHHHHRHCWWRYGRRICRW
jgi:hypothetical protein